ncbi:hypothetical protein FRB99_008281 [Tulasnella sp. 403]|nr:hypothetical protein FRB99_008281 [Tulasnella sp. 403]
MFKKIFLFARVVKCMSEQYVFRRADENEAGPTPAKSEPPNTASRQQTQASAWRISLLVIARDIDRSAMLGNEDFWEDINPHVSLNQRRSSTSFVPSSPHRPTWGTVQLDDPSIGYAYYHFSGIKDLADLSRSVHRNLRAAKESAFEKARDPNQLIQHFRDTAKSYAVFIPGASSYVDTTFDALEELHRTHKEEVEAILGKGYQDLRVAVRDGKMDGPTLAKVMAVFKQQSSELLELTGKVGADVVGPVLDKHPELKEKLGHGWDDLTRLVQEAKDTDVAQQAQDLYRDTIKQLVDIYRKGFSPEALAKARELVDTKAKEVKELSQAAAQKVWEKGQKEYLSKAPDDVKKLLSDSGTISALTTGSGAAAVATGVWGKVREIAQAKGGFNEENTKQLKDLLQEKIKQAKEKAAESNVSLESWLKSVPGGEKALSSIDRGALTKLATSTGEEAQNLRQETYSEILQVLKSKSERAEQLGSGGSQNSRDKGSSTSS